MDDRLLTPHELAERLRTSLDWGYRHWKDCPFTVKLSPRQRRFSAQGLAHSLARQQHEGRSRPLVPGYDEGQGLGTHAWEAARGISGSLLLVQVSGRVAPHHGWVLRSHRAREDGPTALQGLCAMVVEAQETS